jgi:hypothetical protein
MQGARASGTSTTDHNPGTPRSIGESREVERGGVFFVFPVEFPCLSGQFPLPMFAYHNANEKH